jgi:hypothetical protein
MSTGWINGPDAAPYYTRAPFTYPGWYGDLGPGDIVCTEVVQRLRATLAPWGDANLLLSWFKAERIQRVHLLDRGDYAVAPVLAVYLNFRSHDEVPGSLDVNSIRVNVAIVAEALSLTGILENSEASVETILTYIKRFLASQRQLGVTINGTDIILAKNGGATFGQVSFVPELRAVGSGERVLSAWILPVDYGVGVDVAGGQIETVRSVDPNT